MLCAKVTYVNQQKEKLMPTAGFISGYTVTLVSEKGISLDYYIEHIRFKSVDDVLRISFEGNSIQFPVDGWVDIRQSINRLLGYDDPNND